MRRMKAKKAYAQDHSVNHTSTIGHGYTGINTNVANGGAKTDGVHHLGTMVFLAINFVLWTVAGALIEDSLGNDGNKRVHDYLHNLLSKPSKTIQFTDKIFRVFPLSSTLLLYIHF